MPVKKTTTTSEVIQVPAIDIREVILTIEGDSPLIMHKWSEKAKREMLDAQMQKAKTKKHDVKSPIADFIDSLYWLEGEPTDKSEEGFQAAIAAGARFCFPATAFKAAAIAAGYRAGIMPNMVGMRGAIHIPPEYLEILSQTGDHIVPEMREDMTRVGMGKADIRYRGQFNDWRVDIPIRYNAGMVSLEALVNLFNMGGFACGVGEWRIEKGGKFGAFHVKGLV
jgi:hypothetical protein